MTGLIVKLIVCPAVVYLTSIIFSGQVSYPFLYQLIIVGFVLAIAGHLMEVWMLNKKTIWTSTGMDFVAATILVYLSGFVFSGATITLLGALVTAFLLAITEVIQHYYLISSGKVERAN